MSCACLPIDTDKSMIDTVETFELSNVDERGIDHVVHMNVIGLTGIILDSAKTKELVSRDKNMLVPPRQMKASLVVIRDDKVYGMSSLSKGLIQSVAASSSIASSGKPARKQRRYLAMWNSSKTSNEHSSILFEADFSENSSCVPHKNFDLFIGLTANVDSVTTTIPIGVASLPLAEAAALQGPSGKVVLDLPVYNLSPVQASSNNVFTKTFVESDNSNETNRKNKRRLFSSFRKRQFMRDKAPVEPVVPCVQISKKPCLYSLDTSQEDPSILRVELELHQKESNVEIGMSSLSYVEPPLADDSVDKGNRAAVSSPENITIFECDTSVHNMDFLGRHSPAMEQFMEDQSFERVLSTRTEYATPVKSKFQFYPTRRFRVKCIDRTSSKFEFTPIQQNYDDHEAVPQSPPFLEQLKEFSSCDEDLEINEDLIDLPIERVLSESPIVDDDALMAALAQLNEEDYSLQGNEILFDEKSFLSRDTTAYKSEKEMIAAKFLKLDVKPDDEPKTLKLSLFWRRGNKVKASEARNLPSVAGTESSNHSSSNSESTSDSLVQTFEKSQVKCSSDQLISVSSNSELICESSPKLATTSFPISILRTPSTLKHKAKELVNPTPVTSVEELDVFRVLPVETNNESYSVVSSSADTAIFKKESPLEANKHRVGKSSGEGITKEAQDSEQALTTNTTTQASPYSNSLPHFVNETTTPIVLREKYEFDDDNGILKREMSPFKLLSLREATCSPDETFSRNDKPVVRRNLAQNLFRFVELQPCAGKIAIDDEDFTIGESWTHNENSTLGTYDPPKVTVHDDLADLGLLFDDMCRQSGFRPLHDDFSIVEEGTARGTIYASLLDRNGGKKRWLTALGGTASKPVFDSLSRKKPKRKGASRPPLANADDDSDIEEQSLSDQSSENSADEQTVRSSTEESASQLSEQGTEVDVSDVNVVSSAQESITKVVKHHHASKSPSRNLKIISHRLLCEHEKNSNTEVSKTSSSLPALSQSCINWKLEVDIPTSQEIKTENAPSITTIPMLSRAQLPPKDPNRKISSQILLSNKMKTKRRLSELGDGSNGSRHDSLTPSRKSIAQSFVDFVEYVITPSPSSTVTPSVPILLDGDDASSVGELTATTYERQVEVDEMRRQSAKQLSSPVDNNNVPVVNDSYFAEYDGNYSPDIAAALEAAAIKKMAENWVGHPQ
jgi:hypothetical protein